MCAPWICEISVSGVFRVVLDNRAVCVQNKNNAVISNQSVILYSTSSKLLKGACFEYVCSKIFLKARLEMQSADTIQYLYLACV